MLSDRAQRVGNNYKELEIFDHFQIDYNLPKHKKEETGEYLKTDTVGGISFSTENDMDQNPHAWVNVPTAPSKGMQGIQNVLTFKERLINLLLKKLKKSQSTEEEKPIKQITIVEFFINLSKSYEELTPIADIAKHYENALIQTKIMGQVALLEKLKDCIDVVRGEAHLIAMGLKKYVSEKQIIDFYEKVGKDKNLKLTWIRNFKRIIPEDVYLVKKDVDERKIFDNYVVLHYDPANNGEALTKAEIEKKKDPILFGVIKNSKKLYYIADWKDEYCDLTLEEMFNVLGEKVLKINNKTVKTFIDKTKV